MSKRFYLEELIEEIRSLAEQYDTDEHDSDIFVLKTNELTAFSEDLSRVIKNFVEKELVLGESEEEIETDEYEDMFWLEDDDELE